MADGAERQSLKQPSFTFLHVCPFLTVLGSPLPSFPCSLSPHLELRILPFLRGIQLPTPQPHVHESSLDLVNNAHQTCWAMPTQAHRTGLCLTAPVSSEGVVVIKIKNVRISTVRTGITAIPLS